MNATAPSTAGLAAAAASMHRRPAGRRSPDPRSAIVLLLAAALTVSPLAFGYYDFTTWAPLGLGAIVLLVVLALGPAPRLSSFGTAAVLGLGLLLALSFASLAWAQSRDSAWTSANQIAVYAVVLGIGLTAIRTRSTARAVMFVLGLPALVSALVLAVEFAIGTGSGAVLAGRLQSPMGYINGTAGMLVMGVWPWLGIAERARDRRVRAGAIAAASLIASTALLTQSRAIVLATVASLILTLVAAPGRTRRGVNLLIVLGSVAAGAHWTLAVYSSTGPQQLLAPGAGTLRGAGLAVLGAAVVGAGLKAFAGLAASRIPEHRRTQFRVGLGRALLAATVVAVLAGVAVEHGRIATQWRDFTSLNAERASSDRFLTLGSGFRDDLWRVAVDEFAAHPLGGVGAGSYASEYYTRRHQLEDVTTPHSLELQMLAELGVGGAIGLALFVLAVLAAGVSPRGRPALTADVSPRRHATLTADDPGLRVAALGAFTAWLAATSVDWLYDFPGLTAMALLAAAVLLAPAPGSRQRRRCIFTARSRRKYASPPNRQPDSPRPFFRRRLGTFAALVVLAALAASIGRQYVATLYSDSGQALVNPRPSQALHRLRSAEQLDPWSVQTQVAIASAYARLDDYPASRAALRHAARLEPRNYVPQALLGDLATRHGDYATALADYQHALKLDPLEPLLQQAVTAARAHLR